MDDSDKRGSGRNYRSMFMVPSVLKVTLADLTLREAGPIPGAHFEHVYGKRGSRGAVLCDRMGTRTVRTSSQWYPH